MSDGLAPSSLDRAELVSLLETLGSENDEEVLAAARVLDSKVSAAGTTWDALLSARIGADEAGDEDEDEGVEPAPGLPADAGTRDAETSALIEKLLARSGHSDDFRQELQGYKEDLAEGELTDGDHSYIRALYKRLAG